MTAQNAGTRFPRGTNLKLQTVTDRNRWGNRIIEADGGRLGWSPGTTPDAGLGLVCTRRSRRAEHEPRHPTGVLLADEPSPPRYMSSMGALDGFSEERRCYDGSVKAVFSRGHGPGVVIIHEIPGMTPELFRFGRIVADHGFTAILPHLFGEPGRPFRVRDAGAEILRACISREFRVLSRRRKSPVTDWLRALCRDVHAAQGGPGVGVIGMCLTGNFALGMLVDPVVMAPVLSQPSLPFSLTPSHGSALQLTKPELDEVRRRTTEDGMTVLGLRFTGDLLCPGSRFSALRAALGDGFEGIEIASGPGNPNGISPLSHAVLTRDLVDIDGHPTQQALARVLAFLDERLKPV